MKYKCKMAKLPCRFILRKRFHSSETFPKNENVSEKDKKTDFSLLPNNALYLH